MSRAKKKLQLVICGLGGQGVVFLSRVLAEAVIAEGRDVLVSETHGMAQRGGAVESYVKIGGFFGPVVRPGRADAALVADPSRLAAGRRLLREGGACFVNAPEEQAGGQEGCDAFSIAKEIGNPRGANLVLLGFAAASRPDLFPALDACRAALLGLLPPGMGEANAAALDSGAAAAGRVGG